MSVIGIVCEFNPFHNGHKYLIDSVKKQGDVVVCVMSGNYVQRGEPSIFPKDVRVSAALQNGVDLVLELPFVYATASAEYFAKNAVKILDAFGCDKIAFGTENATVEELSKIVDILYDKDLDTKVKTYLEKGMNYPSARQSALNEYSNTCNVSTPNNILALEYLKALKEINSKMNPIAISRIGVGYNDNFAVKNIASATYIRNLINNNEEFKKYVPENTCELYKKTISQGNFLSYEKYDFIFQGILRSKMGGYNQKVANMSEGLENRIEDAVKNSVTLNELYEKVKTKRYTHSRIRRAVLCQVFDVMEDDIEISVPYCKLLGYNNSFSNQIGEMVNKCKLPFIVRYSDINKLNNQVVNRIFEFENTSTDIYNLILHSTDVCSKEKTYFPKKI